MLLYTRDVGMAFLLSDVISIGKFQSPQIASCGGALTQHTTFSITTSRTFSIKINKTRH